MAADDHHAAGLGVDVPLRRVPNDCIESRSVKSANLDDVEAVVGDRGVGVRETGADVVRFEIGAVDEEVYQ